MNKRFALIAVALASLSFGCTRTPSNPALPVVPISEPTTAPAYVAPGGVPVNSYEFARELFIELPKRTWDFMRGRTPTSLANKMEDPDFPDERRAGIAGLAKRPFGRRQPYTTRYQQVADSDAEPIVRATAIRALNSARDTSARPVFTRHLSDPDANVRLEACKALANVPDPAAQAALLRVFTNVQENADVRIAAADALRHYRNLDVARALVNVLADRDFGLSWQSRQSLREMTSGDRGYDQAGWLNFLTSAENPLG